MDRLQEALNKARSLREENTGEGAARSGAARPQKTASGDVAEAWAALSPIKIHRKTLIRNRLVSFPGGKDAAPYDMLRTKIVQQARNHGWRRVAIVSPHRGCGKSTTAANLAFSFGRQRDVYTMVLDFDLRRPHLAKLLAQRQQYSMSDVLERRVSFAAHGLRHESNVAFGLNAGPAHNPSELLQSRESAEVLEEIDAIYKPDIVLFDMPPLMVSDDSYGFLKNVDCALLLVAAEVTNMDQIDVAERQLAELTSVMGIVLNKCRYMSGAYGFEYGYS